MGRAANSAAAELQLPKRPRRRLSDPQLSYLSSVPHPQILQAAATLAQELREGNDDAYDKALSLLSAHGLDRVEQAPALAAVVDALLESATASDPGELAQAPARIYFHTLDIDTTRSDEIVVPRQQAEPLYHLRAPKATQTLCGKSNANGWDRGHRGDFAVAAEVGRACKSCQAKAKQWAITAAERELPLDASQSQRIRAALLEATATVIASQPAAGTARSEIREALANAINRELGHIAADALFARADYSEWIKSRLPYATTALAEHYGSWDQVPKPGLEQLRAAFEAAATSRLLSRQTLFRDKLGASSVFYSTHMLPQLIATTWPNDLDMLEEAARKARPNQGTMATTDLIAAARRLVASS